MSYDKTNVDYSLCLVTDRFLMSTPTIEEAVENAISGGITMVQYRDKAASSSEMYSQACKIKRICVNKKVPLIVNDRLDIALAVGSAGIHIGQSDLPAAVVKKIIGEHMILGVSATNASEAIQAQKDGADYIGVGAMIPTDSKADAKIVSREELAAIREAVTIPIMIIGGLNKSNLPQFAGMGVNAVAIISAIIAQPDIKAAASDIRELLKSVYKI